ncbi:MAG: DUF2232 domain-containing protein [Gemmatimonadales bacterium]
MGFLLLASHFFLAPFAVLLILARPRSARELVILALAILGVAVVVRGTAASGLGLDLVNAGSLALAVAFGLLSWRLHGSVLFRGGLALLIAATAIGTWCWLQGITWAAIERSFTTMWIDLYSAIPALSQDSARQAELRQMVAPAIAGAPAMARIFPGMMALFGLAGMALASQWHHRVATQPLGSQPTPFRAFRFNDQLIWGAIFTLASWLAPLPPEGRALTLNLLVVWAGLYAFRGLAVFAALLAGAPVFLRVSAAVLAGMLWPVALGTCVAVGLGDTWLDIRGRLQALIREGVR